MHIAEGAVERLPCVREDVPQKKRQDADGERVEELPLTGLQPAHASEWQPCEDAAARDDAEQKRMPLAQRAVGSWSREIRMLSMKLA